MTQQQTIIDALAAQLEAHKDDSDAFEEEMLDRLHGAFPSLKRRGKGFLRVTILEAIASHQALWAEHSRLLDAVKALKRRTASTGCLGWSTRRWTTTTRGPTRGPGCPPGTHSCGCGADGQRTCGERSRTRPRALASWWCSRSCRSRGGLGGVPGGGS